MKINVSIEARMTSTRLPGKVLMPILGMPMLELQIRKVREAELVNEIIVATTKNAADDPIIELCERLGVRVYRGSEHDVLRRVIESHRACSSDLIVELTGDNPLQDPTLVDQCIKYFKENDFHYVSNCVPHREYPEGMNVQVFPLSVLEEVGREALDSDFREHVSLYIYKSGKYRIGYVGPQDRKLTRPEISFTVDTKEEFEFVKGAAEHFSDTNFSLSQLISVVDCDPKLRAFVDKARKVSK